MKTLNDILLLSCYELGHPPLALASTLGFLESHGYRPQFQDLAVERLNPEKVKQARFIGISAPMHTALRLGVRVADQIQKINAACHLCFFGLYAHLNADILLKKAADTVIGGEFEAPLMEILKVLEEGRAPQNIEGVSTRSRPSKPYLRRIPFAAPSRQGSPPLSKYAQLEFGGSLHLAGAVESSRGCKHLCRHCPIPPVYGGRFFAVPLEIVLEDIRRLWESGARHITFSDPDFLNGPGHALAVVRRMHEAHPSLTFDFTAKIEHILKARDLFPEFKKLGCLFVISAVESLNDPVLSALRKGHSAADVPSALGILREEGIVLRPSLVPFSPWETLESYLELLEWIEREDLIETIDPVHLSIRLLIPPGSLLLDALEMRPHLGGLDEERFSFEWRHPDPRMDELQGKLARIVEEAGSKEDPFLTFQKVKDSAYGMAGLRTPPTREILSHRSPRPPRLTETWFCCAEPTDDLFRQMENFY